MPDLIDFNVFGLIKVTRDRITIQATAARKDGKVINRGYIEDQVEPINEVAPDDFGSCMFGARLEDDEKSMTIIHDINTLKSFEAVADLPQVGPALKRALDMVRKAYQTA